MAGRMFMAAAEEQAAIDEMYSKRFGAAAESSQALALRQFGESTFEFPIGMIQHGASWKTTGNHPRERRR